MAFQKCVKLGHEHVRGPFFPEGTLSVTLTGTRAGRVGPGELVAALVGADLIRSTRVIKSVYRLEQPFVLYVTIQDPETFRSLAGRRLNLEEASAFLQVAGRERKTATLLI